MIIAIDGPAASGKGTIAKALGDHYRLPHLDTGLLYRAVGRAVASQTDPKLFESQAIAAAQNLDHDDLDPKILMSAQIGELASRVAVIPEVRAALYQYQRDFATQPGGAILDGRDVGTIICPEAEIKLFIIAESRSRAERRARQLSAPGAPVDVEELHRQIEQRDHRDQTAPHGGFHPAKDAHLLDTTLLDIEAAIRAAVAIVDAAMARKAGS